MKKELLEYAVENIPEKSEQMIIVKTSDSGTYWSMGFSASSYAEKSLYYSRTLLELLGFKTEIKESNVAYYGTYRVHSATYELWANISKFDFYCLENGGTGLSILDWAVLCWRSGVNPRVYAPFLSDVVSDKALSLAHSDYKIRIKNFEITQG